MRSGMIGPPVSASFGRRRRRIAGPDAAATRAAHAANRAVPLPAGLPGLAGLVCLATHAFFGLGVGGMESVTAYPFTLWIASMEDGCFERRRRRGLVA
jgi:hypothetical protein